MILFDQVLGSLETKYKILGTFYYSTLNQAQGEKILYDWLYSVKKEVFEPKERLVFVQDCNDTYEYNDQIGNQTTIIFNALKIVDISNSFVTVITCNENISKELTDYNNINDFIEVVIVPGSYNPIIPVFEDTFCVLPWKQLYIGPEGDVLPCCAGDPKFPLGNINQDSLPNIYNNKKFQKLRQGMLTNKRPKECKHCWVKESSGIKSLRQMNSEKNTIPLNPRKDGLVDSFTPSFLDLRLNKLCNLKCRSCSPYYSSAIAEEVKSIYNVEWMALTHSQRKNILLDLIKLLPNVTEIYFAGGEPLLSQEQFIILKELEKIGNTNLDIFYNTNFMQLTLKEYSYIDIWKNFSNVKIGASLDAHGKVAEYLRHGTVWSTIESNLKELKHGAPNVKISVTSTVGFLNIENLIELQQDWTKRNLLTIDQFEISQIIFDSFFSPQVAPKHHKEQLTVAIEQHLKWLSDKGNKKLSDRWQQVIDYMWQQDLSYLLPEFKRTMQNQDNYRNENFNEIFPQFADLMI